MRMASTQQGENTTFPAFHLGDRLRKARETAGYTAVEFAKTIGISRDSLRVYEAGTTVPKRPVLIAWAMATGFTVDQLENGTPPEGGGADQHVDEFKHTRLAA